MYCESKINSSVFIDCMCDVKHELHYLNCRSLPLCLFSLIHSVLLSTAWSLFLTRTQGHLDLRLILYYPRVHKTNEVLWDIDWTAVFEGFSVGFSTTFVWIMSVCSKPISLSTYWWRHHRGGNYSPFYFTITMIIRVGWHSPWNSWDQ